jgi:hypothetical protein
LNTVRCHGLKLLEIDREVEHHLDRRLPPSGVLVIAINIGLELATVAEHLLPTLLPMGFGV